MRLFMAAALFAVASMVVTAADEKKEEKVKDAVTELKLDASKLKENENGKASAPTVIKTEDELKKAVGEDAAKAMGVDFKKKYLLLFQWSGSGGDKLSHAPSRRTGRRW